ncbi:MAG: recombination protein NinB [Candidatus Paceibacterota bacterium]|jgi:hypothetical protein
MAAKAISYEIKTMFDIPGAIKWASENATKGLRAGTVVFSLGRIKRTNDQNSKMWPMLTDVSKQVDWYGEKLTTDDWKQVFSAAWKQQKAVPGIDGGFVVCGVSTSKLNKKDFSELIEIIYAFGAEHGVKWSEPSLQTFSQYREAA